ncbi:glycosyltransferase [Lysinibacillus sp. BW-2-10]|uniref:glycosyltransferase family 2 protein n=1 Tax=Lysinibacillus sp. BW-2-10 TaxID=2590030 RepID=UPI00117CCE71|nr:glycosyltransferase [Lysinibacillus sp. BW-2-10]TSI11330.1 glycosyltransferase [Lysinibacillus sp. BW-2-10]
MNLQVLLSTMNQNDTSILNKMNIQSDIIIVNQCNRNHFDEFTYNGNNVKFLSLAERGIGLSRNTALMRATADVCLFADDDVSYVDNYKDIILDEFKKYPNADILLFNVYSTNPKRTLFKIQRCSRVRFFNCLRYGAVMMAIRTEQVRRANVYFSLLFGGGAKYSAGEDSLFLAECIRKGLRVYAIPKKIGYVSQEESSWFDGYTEKYFVDKGVFYANLSKRWASLLCFQFAIRHKKMFGEEKSVIEALRLMRKGRDIFRYS